jgi:hypothetical protein
VFARIKRAKQRRFRTVEFVPVRRAFTPQVEVTFNKDVAGWVNQAEGKRYSFSAGRTYMVDEDTAVNFIVKGYARGELPRPVSDDEAAEIRSVMTTVGVPGG